jgi:hypothetical protein
LDNARVLAVGFVGAEHKGSPWLFSRSTDLLVLSLPVWLTWSVCFVLPAAALERTLPLWMWAVFIVGIDVSHVWSTLFRTYLDREEFAHHRAALLRTPVLAFGLFLIIAGLSPLWFWRLMAYLALFHFVKQQYGFFALYRARFGFKVPHQIFADARVIYLATLYPVAYWHLQGDRNFNWFVSGDFFGVPALPGSALSLLFPICNVLYWTIIAGWCAEEIYLCRKHQVPLATGKILWLLTTAGNWYLGIVHFNSDIVFTLTNVIAHGGPYLALVFFYVDKKAKIKAPAQPTSGAQIGTSLLFMLAVILLLAFGEEYLWDMFLYRERGALFEWLFAYPIHVLQTPVGQALALALLSVPQVTHYVLDGFIWKNNEKNPYLRRIFK